MTEPNDRGRRRPRGPGRPTRRTSGRAKGPADSSAPAGRKPARAGPTQRPAGGVAKDAGRGPTRRPRTVARATANKSAASHDIDSNGERIAKLLARAGVGSRRDIERMIEAGRIAVAGQVLTTPATILTSLRDVTIDGRPAPAIDSTRVFLFHKPVGVLTAAHDSSGRPTIYDILPADLPRLIPVGRLDLNTEGLLLLTNDGGLKRALELPANGVPRSYRIRALGTVHQSQLEALATGIRIDGMQYGPVDASIERRARPDGANIWLSMTLREGKNREVRKLCEALGLKVSRLIRTHYGPFALADLPVRAVVEIAPAEVARLKQDLARARTNGTGSPG